MTNQLINPRFPRSSKYNPEWMLEGPFGGNAVWLAEWLTDSLVLKPGMRKLDLGCGRAKSSIFLANEFDVQVWATDLWLGGWICAFTQGGQNPIVLYPHPEVAGVQLTRKSEEFDEDDTYSFSSDCNFPVVANWPHPV